MHCKKKKKKTKGWPWSKPGSLKTRVLPWYQIIKGTMHMTSGQFAYTCAICTPLPALTDLQLARPVYSLALNLRRNNRFVIAGLPFPVCRGLQDQPAIRVSLYCTVYTTATLQSPLQVASCLSYAWWIACGGGGISWLRCVIVFSL